MELKFFGDGGAFSIKKSSSSAYLPYGDNKLFIIDCGETVVKDIMEFLEDKNFNFITIFITHLHSDHMGGLPTLLYYLKLVKNIECTVIIDSAHGQLTQYLDMTGIWDVYDRTLITYLFKQKIEQKEEFQKLMNAEAYVYMDEDLSFRIFDSPHVQSCNSLIIGKRNKTYTEYIFFSGDNAAFNTDVFKFLEYTNIRLSKWYQDISTDTKQLAHMTEERFKKGFPAEIKTEIHFYHNDKYNAEQVAIDNSNPCDVARTKIERSVLYAGITIQELELLETKGTTLDMVAYDGVLDAKIYAGLRRINPTDGIAVVTLIPKRLNEEVVIYHIGPKWYVDQVKREDIKQIECYNHVEVDK